MVVNSFFLSFSFLDFFCCPFLSFPSIVCFDLTFVPQLAKRYQLFEGGQEEQVLNTAGEDTGKVSVEMDLRDQSGRQLQVEAGPPPPTVASRGTPAKPRKPPVIPRQLRHRVSTTAAAAAAGGGGGAVPAVVVAAGTGDVHPAHSTVPAVVHEHTEEQYPQHEEQEEQQYPEEEY